jgi:uncharacterized repeat protein (TIGR01451 family)
MTQVGMSVLRIGVAGFAGVAVVAVAVVVVAPALAPAQETTPSADLSLTKSDSPDPVVSGAQLTYNIEVRNLGPDPATDVAITDNLPGGLDRLSVTPSVGTCNDKDKITGDIPSLANGEVATVTIVVTVTKKKGSITNSASVQWAGSDPQAANNLGTETTKVSKAPGPAGPSCRGRDPTIVGTEGDDSITGTDKRDVIVALGGNDTVFGLGGNDVICGFPGNDTIRGGAGIDVIRGASGRDVLKAGSSNDRVGGGLGRDRLGGGLGSDVLHGGPGRDRCNGGPGTDVKRSC